MLKAEASISDQHAIQKNLSLIRLLKQQCRQPIICIHRRPPLLWEGVHTLTNTSRPSRNLCTRISSAQHVHCTVYDPSFSFCSWLSHSPSFLTHVRFVWARFITNHHQIPVIAISLCVENPSFVIRGKFKEIWEVQEHENFVGILIFCKGVHERFSVLWLYGATNLADCTDLKHYFVLNIIFNSNLPPGDLTDDLVVEHRFLKSLSEE